MLVAVPATPGCSRVPPCRHMVLQSTGRTARQHRRPWRSLVLQSTVTRGPEHCYRGPAVSSEPTVHGHVLHQLQWPVNTTPVAQRAYTDNSEDRGGAAGDRECEGCCLGKVKIGPSSSTEQPSAAQPSKFLPAPCHQRVWAPCWWPQAVTVSQ